LLTGATFGLPGLPKGATRLSAQLASRHALDGFEPVAQQQFVNQFDPLELIPRAYDYWDRHRWPGRSGREQYADAIYAATMLRHLALLSMRIWDDGDTEAQTRLGAIQSLVDALNLAGQPKVFIRDARWLIPIAQGPLTRDLAPYFAVSDHVAGSFDDSTRLGLHKANARLAGGHLRSQLRYRGWETGRPAGDPQNLVITRNSNALDGALLVGSLVPLLEAYEGASLSDDRRDLADAILQGVSADPELFLIRLDLLTPYTMIEHLFIGEGPSGDTRYTSRGDRHVRTLARYRDLLGALTPRLIDDALAGDPARQAYSPHGIAYGFCADVLSNIAWDFLVSNPTFELSLEDMFVSFGDVEEKRARARAWEALPTREGERAHFEYSPDAAAESFARVMEALAGRAQAGSRLNATGGTQARIFVGTGQATERPAADLPGGLVSAGEHCLTSDAQRVSRDVASFCPRAQILEDRNEGRFLASIEDNGAWIAVSKVILTLFTSRGIDALIDELPSGMIPILRLTCPDLIVLTAGFASKPELQGSPPFAPRA
jgi:hypothetical protein